jgi:hypothetical protein
VCPHPRPGIRLVGLAGVACLLSLTAPRLAPAQQVRGVVTDAAGRPLPGVLVELWDSGRRLAGDGTDASGHFFLAAPGTGRRAILARAIGLVPLRRLLTSADTVVTLVMQPSAIEVTAATVTTEETACPRRDDRRARALWQEAARHYDVGLSALGVYTWTQRAAAVVPVESLGVIDTTRLHGVTIGGGSRGFIAYRAAEDRGFYARPNTGMGGGRFDLWEYLALESTVAWHFADSLFARLNTLALEASATGETAIAFCSRRGNAPYVRGRLLLSADTTLAGAEWEFVTPPPSEHAGGRVLFAPVDPNVASAAILPIAGLFWRRTPRGVYQEWTEYRQWYRCENQDCSLPLR